MQAFALIAVTGLTVLAVGSATSEAAHTAKPVQATPAIVAKIDRFLASDSLTNGEKAHSCFKQGNQYVCVITTVGTTAQSHSAFVISKKGKVSFGNGTAD